MMSKPKMGPGGSRQDLVFWWEPSTMFPQNQACPGTGKETIGPERRRLGCLLEVARKFLLDIIKKGKE